MRRGATRFVITLIITLAVAALASVVLTRRALAAAKDAPPVLCLDTNLMVQMRIGAVPLVKKDMIVAESANFAMRTRNGPSLWWHVREVIIHGAYRTFWPQESRAATFEQIASRMRRCPPAPMGRNEASA